MRPINTAWLAAALVITPAAALAEGTHAGGHGAAAPAAHGHAGVASIGAPADAGTATRTIAVSMMETDRGMVFEPAAIAVQRGETVRLVIANDGQLVHEFVMDSRHEIEEHKALMERFPEMIHDDPNSVSLEPGAQGEIVWTFTEAGTFEFACLIPGHYDAGMHGPLTVTQS